MNIQYIIVIAIILGAFAYAGLQLRKRSRAFSPKAGCGKEDCGCK